MENQPNPDPLLGVPPWASELANRMRTCEQNLAELTSTINGFNQKIDVFMAQLGVQVPGNNFSIGSTLTPGPWWHSDSTAPQPLQYDVASG